jgi:hypothetical protein
VGTGEGQAVQLRIGTEGNCTVGQVLFLTEQVSLQKTPPKEPSWQRVKTDVIVQFLQTRPPVGTEGGGLGETEGAGTFVAGETEGAGTFIAGVGAGTGMFIEGTGLIGGSTEAVILAIAKKDENSERGLKPLDGNI